jgi:hypothetical protein
MTKLAFLIPLVLLTMGCKISKELNVKNIEGYKFSLHDVEKYCTIERQGDQHLDVTCSDKKLRPVMGACEGQLTAGLIDPAFYCSGGLWVLNDMCYIQMLSTQKGNIKCKKQ